MMGILLTTMVATSTGAAAATGDLCLFEIDPLLADEYCVPEDVTVLFRARDYLIVVTEGEEAIGSATVLLEGPVDIERLVMVHLSSELGAVWLGEIGDVLLLRDDEALVLCPGERPPFFVRPGIRMVHPLRPYVRSAAASRVEQREFDGMVEDIVAAVSEDSLMATIQHLEDYGTRLCVLPQYDQAASWVDQWFGLHWIPCDQQWFTFYGDDMSNVIAEITGLEEPDSIYIICGHLDSITWPLSDSAPGADDNASGSATVLEAARVMAPYNFRYTVRFICFGAEEVGLIGSEFYAQSAYSAGEAVKGVINLDMILYSPPGFDSLWIPYDAQSEGLAQAVVSAMGTYVPELEVVSVYDPSATYSDHSSFWQYGYPAVLGIEYAVDDNPFYHSPTDLLENYSSYWPFGTLCAKGAIAALASLAMPLGPSGAPGGGVAGPSCTLAVWPNPAVSSAQASISGVRGNYSVSICDITGRIVGISESIGGLPALLQLENLPSGVYVVSAEAEGSTISSRLAILR